MAVDLEKLVAAANITVRRLCYIGSGCVLCSTAMRDVLKRYDVESRVIAVRAWINGTDLGLYTRPTTETTSKVKKWHGQSVCMMKAALLDATIDCLDAVPHPLVIDLPAREAKAFMEYRAALRFQAGAEGGPPVEVVYRREKVNPAELHPDPRITRIIGDHVQGIYNDLVAGREPQFKKIGALIAD